MLPSFKVPRRTVPQLLLTIALIAVPVAGFSALELLTAPATAPVGLGDMHPFLTIVSDVETLASRGDLAAAKHRITDFESAWDSAETSLRAKNPELWTAIDDAADAALHAARASKPNAKEVAGTLTALLAALNSADA
jgi:hypothetical protein